MKFHAALSTERDTLRAIGQMAEETINALGRPPDLSLVFLSPHHRRSVQDLTEAIHRTLAPRALLGCTGEGIIGSTQEIERQPAIALWSASLPEVTLNPFHLSFEEDEKGVRMRGWPQNLPTPEQDPFFILMADPFSTPTHELLTFFQHRFPSVPVLGGMVSGARTPGENLLVQNGQIYKEGVVALSLHGAIRLEAVVSQGCRPIGERLLITRAEQNVIDELGGRPALQRLTELFEKLSEEERELAHRGLYIGCAIDEHKAEFGRGDFLTRSLIGIDEERGSLTVGDLVHEGQTVQFHVRDAESAREDLNLLLEGRRKSLGGAVPEAGLLFSCNGRGRRFFGSPDQDVRMIQGRLGTIPLAGFFAQGEIGPVGQKNFLHGFTASLALFCRPTD